MCGSVSLDLGTINRGGWLEEEELLWTGCILLIAFPSLVFSLCCLVSVNAVVAAAVIGVLEVDTILCELLETSAGERVPLGDRLAF